MMFIGKEKMNTRGIVFLLEKHTGNSHKLTFIRVTDRLTVGCPNRLIAINQKASWDMFVGSAIWRRPEILVEL